MAESDPNAMDAFDLPATCAGVRVLEPLQARLTDRAASDLARRTHVAVGQFQWLDGVTVSLGRLPPDDEGDVNGRAHPANNLVCLPVETPISNVTLYHELAHIAVYRQHWCGDDVPHTSEAFTSLYAMRAMPADRIDTDYIPYLGEPQVETDRWPEIAADALAERKNGRQAYIQWAQEQLRILGGER